MNHHEQFDALLHGPAPFLALAPMQDVTDLPFWKLMARYGGADVYCTEYFRVHATSQPGEIHSSIHRREPHGPARHRADDRQRHPALVRTAKELQQYPDRRGGPEPRLPRADRLPQVRRRRLAARTERVDAILGALREAVQHASSR